MKEFVVPKYSTPTIEKRASLAEQLREKADRVTRINEIRKQREFDKAVNKTVAFGIKELKKAASNGNTFIILWVGTEYREAVKKRFLDDGFSVINTANEANIRVEF